MSAYHIADDSIRDGTHASPSGVPSDMAPSDFHAGARRVRHWTGGQGKHKYSISVYFEEERHIALVPSASRVLCGGWVLFGSARSGQIVGICHARVI